MSRSSRAQVSRIDRISRANDADKLFDRVALPGSTASFAAAINNRGQVVGYSYVGNIVVGESLFPGRELVPRTGGGRDPTRI